jgi:ATP-binding protein involved in chromosome partitioning
MSIENKVQRALDEIRPILQSDGGDVSLEGVRDGIAFVRLQGACSGCPSATATLKNVIQEKIREYAPEIKEVREVGGAGEPMVQTESQDAFSAQKTIAGVRSILAVASGKGGVGKSTVAVNLALALKAGGKRVGLLDADIYGPSIPTMLGIDTEPQVGPEGIRPVAKLGLEVMSIGFFIDQTQPVIWRGPMIMKVLEQFLHEVRWGELDYLVVDLPPGTGDAQLTLVQSVPVNGAVVVTTPSDVALIDARRAVDMFAQVGVPVVGIVENMSHFVCPHCGEKSEVFSHGGGARVAETAGVAFLGEIPLDSSVGRGGDVGHPVVAEAPEGAQAGAFHALAAKAAEFLDRFKGKPKAQAAG